MLIIPSPMLPGGSPAVFLDNPADRRTNIVLRGLGSSSEALVVLCKVFRSACSVATGRQDMHPLRFVPSDEMRLRLWPHRKCCSDAVWLLGTLGPDSNIAGSLLAQVRAVPFPAQSLGSAFSRPACDRNARSRDIRMPGIGVLCS